MTTIAVFIATSLDGYIAAEDGSLDWLMAAGQSDEDYGFESFLETVDAVAMGRGTYDSIAHIEELPYGDRPLMVFTHRAGDDRPGVTFSSQTPDAAMTSWTSSGFGRVYIDGGVVISDFLAAGLVDEITITTVPTLLGRGIRLFNPIGTATNLTLRSVRSWPSGMVQSTYERRA